MLRDKRSQSGNKSFYNSFMGFSLGYVLLPVIVLVAGVLVVAPLTYVAVTPNRTRGLAWLLALTPTLLLLGACLNCARMVDREERLVFAAEQGDLAKVRSLLELGVDPNANFDGMQYALEAAALEKHWEVAEILIANGATDQVVEMNLSEGHTISEILVKRGRKDLAGKIGWTEGKAP